MSQVKGPKCQEIFIVNLSPQVDEAMLFKSFQHFGKISKIKIQRDLITKESRGIGFVEYCSPQAGFKAIQMMNHKQLFGQEIQVYNKSWYKENMHDNACLIISNLSPKTTEAELKALFKPFGYIFCVKITEGTYDQLNTATIQFMKESMAIESIKKMHGKEINGEKIQLRLGCKECQVFLKVRSSAKENSKILEKILGEFYESSHIAQQVTNKTGDKVLVHVHFQTIEQCKQFVQEFEAYKKMSDDQKASGRVEDKFIALDDVKSYEERSNIAGEFVQQNRVFQCFIWPLADDVSQEKVQEVLDDFSNQDIFKEEKSSSGLKNKYISNKQEEQQQTQEKTEGQEQEQQIKVEEIKDIVGELSVTRLNRKYLIVKFRSSEKFQEFVRQIYYRNSPIYEKLKIFEMNGEPFKISYDHNTIYQMKNEIHQRIKKSKRSNDFKQNNLTSQFDQFSDSKALQNEIKDMNIRPDVNKIVQDSYEQLQQEMDNTRRIHKDYFDRFSNFDSIIKEEEVFKFLPQNVKNLIFYDLIVGIMKQKNILPEKVSQELLYKNICHILESEVLTYEEIQNILVGDQNLSSFLEALLPHQ